MERKNNRKVREKGKDHLRNIRSNPSCQFSVICCLITTGSHARVLNHFSLESFLEVYVVNYQCSVPIFLSLTENFSGN